MKLFSAEQIRLWDEYTINQEPITSIGLMQRAADACFENLYDTIEESEKIKIFCCKGNNGGDGLALANIILTEFEDVKPTIYILEFGAVGTNDFQKNLAKLHKLTTDIHFLQSENLFPQIDEDDLVIDALFGSGLNRPLEGLSAALVNHINKSEATVISIDVPSGMFIDKSSAGNTIIKATETLTFQALKLCFLMPENASYFGRIQILDIELHPDYPEQTDARFETIEKGFVKSLIKERDAFAHKGNFGHALLIAGSEGKNGAALIAAKACLRSGCGLLTVNTKTAASALNIFIPEAMTNENEINDFSSYSSIGIGPGLGNCEATIKKLFSFYTKPIVIDADGLNSLKNIADWKTKVPAGSILTPHPKEFERLFGECANDFERAEKAIQLSQENNFIIVLKGHHTLIANKGKGYFNTTGNSALAKGGSGDMLTGIITSLLAQGYEPLHAVIIGVHWHGLTANMLIDIMQPETILASDCIEMMSEALTMIKSMHECDD